MTDADHTRHQVLIDHLTTHHHVTDPDKIDTDLTGLHDELHDTNPHIGRYHTADGAHSTDPWSGDTPNGEVWTDPARSAYLEFNTLALHLVSEHGAPATALDSTGEELQEWHDHEHKGPGTIRDHDPAVQNFAPAKVAAAIRTHDHALSELSQRVSSFQARIDATHQPTTEQQLAEIRAILLDALGGPDGVPENATVVDLARAVAATLTQRDNAIESAHRRDRDVRERLEEALTTTGHRDEDEGWEPLVDLADTVANLAVTYHQGVHDTTSADHARKMSDALRRIYDVINTADPINQYDDITRRCALAAVVDTARENGVDL